MSNWWDKYRTENCDTCNCIPGSDACDGCSDNPDEKEYIKEEIKDGIFRLTPVELSGILNIIEAFNGEIVSIKKEKEGEEMGISTDALKDIIKKEVALKIATKECFTAYDITKAIRSFIRSNVSHAEVNSYIRSLVNDGDPVFDNYDVYDNYSAFKGDGVRIYHPEDGDPIEYLNLIDPTTGSNSTDTTNDTKDLKEAALAVIQANDELQRAINTLTDIVDNDDEEDDDDNW
jgi:hypothetical protein